MALMKRRIETQLDEYEAAISAYAAFMEGYRNRTDPAAKRMQRFRRASEQQAAE